MADQETIPMFAIFGVVGAILGALLGAVGVFAIVFLDIPGVSLATGVEIVDSMIYSMPSGMQLVAAAVVYGVVGAVLGAIGGAFFGLLLTGVRSLTAR